MKEFMKNNKSNDKYFILDCEGTYNYKNDMNIFEYSTINSSGLNSKMPSAIRKPIEIYSPDETVIRAKQHIGKQEYDLGVNNCEHFAIWCKTGLKYSYQVNNFLGSRFISNNKKWIDYCMNNDTY